MNYESLLAEADQNGIDVVDYDFKSPRIKGLYCDGTVALSRSSTETEKICTLAEELGHHYTTSGDILDQSYDSNRKQELRARAWAYHKCLQFGDIVEAFNHGCRNRYEIAEYLGVTEAFLQDGIDYYKGKYGPYTKYGNYIIYFEPLGVLKRFSE